MAFDRNVSKELTRMIIILILVVSPVTCANINCDGKAFHCVNSTHFMICVDLGGGVLSALDSFIIQCPLSTECRKTNHYECEFPKPVKLETMDKSVVNDLSPVTDATTISNETSASSPKDFPSYTTGSSDPSIAELLKVTNNVYADKSDLPQESIDIIVPITTESIKILMDTDTANKTKLVLNSLDFAILPNKSDIVQVSTVSKALNQTIQDLVDINVASTTDYQTSLYTSKTSKSETFEVPNITIISTSTDTFQIPAEILTDNIPILNTKTALFEESTTTSPLSTTGFFETITENREPNEQLYLPTKNTTTQNEIENFELSTNSNLLNISDIFQDLTGISAQSTITVSSSVSNKTDFNQALTNNSVSQKFEYLIYPTDIDVSSTTDSNQTPTDISGTTKPKLFNVRLLTNTILPNSEIFQGLDETAKKVTKHNYTQAYQFKIDTNKHNKADIFDVSTDASLSSKSGSLQELVTTNVPSMKEYFQTTTDTSASYNTQLYQLKYSVPDTKTELFEVTDNISSTIGYTEMSKDSSMPIARNHSDINMINENNKYVTNLTSINELQYSDSEYKITTPENLATNIDNIVENNLNNSFKNPDLLSNLNSENDNLNIVFNQNSTADFFVKNTKDVYNKDKALNKVTKDDSTTYGIIKTNFSNLSQDMVTISDIVTNTYTTDVNINTVTKVEELDVPTTENSRNQQITTENGFLINIMSNIRNNMGTIDTISINTIQPLEALSDADLSTSHLKLFSTSPTLVEISSNTENSNQAEVHNLKHTTPYVTVTNSTYDDIKHTVQLTDTKDNILNLNNNRNIEKVNRAVQSDNLDILNLETVNILNNTNNVKLKNITNAAMSLPSYTTESYKNEITILNDSVISQTSYLTSVSGLAELAQNSTIQTTTTNTYVYATTEFVEKGNQLVFPETNMASTLELSPKTKNEYYGLKTKQTDGKNSHNLYSVTNGSLITDPGTSQIGLDSKLSQQVTTNDNLFFDSINTAKEELNKTDRKHIMLVTKDQVEIKSQSTNNQQVSEAITDNNNAKISNAKGNSPRQSGNIDESNLAIVNILNNTKNHKLKSISTAAVFLTSYTTETYKNAITILNDSTISQTSETSFSALTVVAQNSKLRTTTDANSTAEFDGKDNPLIFPKPSNSDIEFSSKTNNEYYDVLIKTMQTDAENANNLYSNTNGFTEPVTSQIELDSTNYKSMQKLNETSTKHTQVTTDQISAGVVSANMQQISNTTINNKKTNANVETGSYVSNNNYKNFYVTPFTYNVTKMFPVTNLTSFQEPVTLKMESEIVNTVDYQIPETTTALFQVDSIKKSVNTSQSILSSTTGNQIDTEQKSSITNRHVTDSPATPYQYIIDKTSVNDTHEGANNFYKRIHELLATSDKKSVSPNVSDTGNNSDASRSIFTNNINSQTLHTTIKLSDNIKTQVDRKSGAHTNEKSKHLSSQSLEDKQTVIIKDVSFNATLITQNKPNNTTKTDQSARKVFYKITNKTDIGNIPSPSSVPQYKEVTETIPISHTTPINFTVVKQKKIGNEIGNKQSNISSIYKSGVNLTDSKSTAAAYEYNLKNKVQLNISLSTDLNDDAKHVLNIGFKKQINLNGTNLLVFHNKTKPTRVAITTNGTWNYRTKPQSIGNNINNSSYLNNNTQNKQVGNYSLISSKTNHVSEHSMFNQINSTGSTIIVKYRNSLKSIVGINNGTISKTTQQKSFSKNDTMGKNATYILKKPEAIDRVRLSQFHCHNRSRGRYSDKEDCSIFYICIGILEPIIGKCPVHTVFSDIRKQCTKNISHCIRESEFKCITAGRFPDIFKSNTYYICVRRNNSFLRYKFQCLNGYYFNKTLVKCMVKIEPESQHQTSISYDSSKSDISFNENLNKKETRSKMDRIKKSEELFKCEKEGKFAAESDCRKYYLCTKNNKSEFRTRKKECDSDEVFHRDKKECVDADSYEC